MAQSYNEPLGELSGTPDASTVGNQIRTDYFYKKALVEAAKESYFGQMADTMSMPRNMGKVIKRYHYLPILDDRNLNDQGIDAAAASTYLNHPIGNNGAATGKKVFYVKVIQPEHNNTEHFPNGSSQQEAVAKYFRGDAAVGEILAADLTDGNTTVTAAATADGATEAEAEDIAEIRAYNKASAWLVGEGVTHTTDNHNTVTVTAVADGYAVTALAADSDANYGNFYGSSKDVGTIAGKIPSIGEHGGRVNRVGMKRIELEGTFEKFGFFTEYTQDSLSFDSDSELLSHLTSEVVKAANEINEDQLQIELLNSAGVIRYPGNASSRETIDGNSTTYANNDVVTYDDLVKLALELDQNRTPKSTKIISGSRMIDTKVVNAARYMYIGSEILPVLMRMVDYHGNKAWIPTAQYASAGNIAQGEVGAIDSWRFIVVPEMMHWEGVGADVTNVDTVFRNNGTKFNVYPMLAVGSGSFTTIGFQTDGKSVKFKTKHVKPEQNYSRDDPYGTTGFYSIQWWFGYMVLRPEHIAITYTLAEW